LVEIVVNSESLERSPTGSITGQIHIAGPSGPFPDDAWHDFPVVVLTWWIAGLRLVASGDRRSYVGDFMDGPFSFRIDADIGDLGRIAWEGCNNSPTAVSITALLQSAVTAGQAVLASCQSRHWTSPDLDNLEQAILAARPNNSFKPNPLRGSA
jgi:hypothetical protein